MFRDKLFYYLANYTLQHSFEKEIIKLIKKERKLVIFDVGCYRGIFVKSILNLLKKRNFTLIKKVDIWSISLFSNIRGADYLFSNNKYPK